ncbi:MAG: outer membrane beta-barrel protein [Saccharospirillaceae bacterium]|nr:hypothetical protein [Pseudomonadales bacterium]NRB77553.1 outer membrane beta-barrel protein [Saccharospirillaceae bacterium]
MKGLSIFKIPSSIIFALWFLVNYAHAQNITVEQLKKTKIHIKSLQQQQNYFAADQLINALIKQDQNNPVYYFDLALNYFYNNQPIQAEQTLSYVINNIDLTNVPLKVKQNIKVFYKKVKLAANIQRKIINNIPILYYNTLLQSGFNNNHNRVTDDVNELVIINDIIAWYEDKDLDPTLVGLENTKNKTFNNSVNVNINYQSKKIKILKQDFQLNHFASAQVENEMIADKDSLVNSSVYYRVEPKFTLDESVIRSHSYPLALNYYSANDYSTFVLSFNPTLDLLKSSRIGYTFNINQQNYLSYQSHTDAINPDDSSLYFYEIEEVNSTTKSNAVYFQFKKRFNLKFKPTLFSKLKISSVVGASEYIRMDALFLVDLFFNEKYKLSQSLQYKLTTYDELSNRQDEEFKIINKITYNLNNNINIASEYQLKIHTSSKQQYQYNQSIFLLSLDWSK